MYGNTQPYVGAPYYGQYPYPYNRDNYYQQQLDQIARPSHMQQHPQTQPQQPGVITRAVTSIDEARAAILDPPTAVHIFTDFTNNQIHVKRLSSDGSAMLHTFVLDAQSANTQSKKYTLDDVMETLAELNTRVANFEREFTNVQESIDASVQRANKWAERNGPNQNGSTVR